jgi:parallel beta-helix repeat protein
MANRLLLFAALVCLSAEPVLGGHFKIRDDAQGGDCRAQQIGIWNPATRTCTLTASQVASISIEDDGITLDGRGLMLRHGPGARQTGVTIQGRKNVVVRRLRVIGFRLGIVIGQGHTVTVERCLVSGPTTTSVGVLLDHTHGNRVLDNRIISCRGTGISFQDSHRNRVVKNTVLLNRQGSILMWESHDNLVAKNQLRGTGARGSLGVRTSSCHRNEFTGNRLSRHSQFGFVLNKSDANRVTFNIVLNNDENGFFLWDGNHNLIYCNDFQGHVLGAELMGQALGNQIWWNNFYLNDTADDLVGGGLNVFHHPRPEGGNYWKPHAPNCADANGDRFCDAPYVFRGSQDPLPHVKPIPWRANPEICTPPPDPPYGGQQKPFQPDTDLAALVETLITTGMTNEFIGQTSDDVSLVTGDRIYEGREEVVSGLGKLIECTGDETEIGGPSEPLPLPGEIVELRVTGCGDSEIELLVITGSDPETGARRIEMLVATPSPTPSAATG